MNRKSTLWIAIVMGSVLTFSCSRSESPAVAESTDPTANAAAAPAVTPSAFKPAPANVAPKKPSASNTASTASNPPAAPKPAPSAPKTITLAAGTSIPVRVGETMSSEQSANGDSWTGTLSEPLVADGLVIAERGARVDGTVVNVKRAGRVKGVASLSIALNRITTADGQVVDVHTSSFAVAGKDETKKDAAKVAIASGVGAAIGAIAGKGKGAAIGAGTGAAAGTGVVLATRGGAAVISNEALVNFRLSDSVTITEKR